MFNIHSQDFESKILNNDYSKTVKLLEKGKTDIDYSKFRNDFLFSSQFRIAKEKRNEISKALKKILKNIDKSDYDKVIIEAEKILDIDYTNMKAHKYLRQTYKILNDTINSKKHKKIQFGLLRSILGSNDGKTCDSAWNVIQISEEYFILEMLGVKLLTQQIESGENFCDKMETENDNGDKKIYFFNIEKIVMEGTKCYYSDCQNSILIED